MPTHPGFLFFETAFCARALSFAVCSIERLCLDIDTTSRSDVSLARVADAMAVDRLQVRLTQVSCGVLDFIVNRDAMRVSASESACALTDTVERNFMGI